MNNFKGLFKKSQSESSNSIGNKKLKISLLSKFHNFAKTEKNGNTRNQVINIKNNTMKPQKDFLNLPSHSEDLKHRMSRNFYMARTFLNNYSYLVDPSPEFNKKMLKRGKFNFLETFNPSLSSNTLNFVKKSSKSEIFGKISKSIPKINKEIDNKIKIKDIMINALKAQVARLKCKIQKYKENKLKYLHTIKILNSKKENPEISQLYNKVNSIDSPAEQRYRENIDKMIEESEKKENQKEVDKLNKQILQYKMDMKDLQNKYSKLKIDKLMIHNLYKSTMNKNISSSFEGVANLKETNNISFSKVDSQTNQNDSQLNGNYFNFLVERENNEIFIKKNLNKTNNIKDLLQSNRLCNLLNCFGNAQKFVDLITIIIKYK